MENAANATILLANFVIVPAIAYSCQLALAALGVTLVFSVLRFSNFAHGELMSAGTMFAIFLTWWFQSMGLTLGPVPTALLALPFAVLACIALALVTDRTVYRFYRQQRANPVILLIVSIGVMFLIGGLIRFLIGPDEQNFADGERFLLNAKEVKAALGLAEGLTIKTSQAVTVVVALIAGAALFWFLDRTKTGKMMRAYSDNEDLALLSGIDPERMVRLAWVLTAILATLAGTLYGLDKGYRPFVYQQILLPTFAAAVVGGLGNPLGAVVGGFVVGFSEVALTYAWTKFFGYLLPADWAPDGLAQILPLDYKFAVSFVILVLILLYRPTGIIKGKAA
jgi:branched-chain amino acid transport system permease protein